MTLPRVAFAIVFTLAGFSLALALVVSNPPPQLPALFYEQHLLCRRNTASFRYELDHAGYRLEHWSLDGDNGHVRLLYRNSSGTEILADEAPDHAACIVRIIPHDPHA